MQELNKIGFADNPLIKNSFPAIAVYLTSCSKLRMLDLSNNQIGKACLQKLPNYVKGNELLLSDLTFKSNGIDEEGLAIICSLNWSSLHTLDVSHNLIGCSNLHILTESLKHCFSHLSTLKISHNKINDDAILALSKTMTKDRECINERSHDLSLRTLDISYNLIGDSGIFHLIEMCTMVVSLNVLKNKMTSLGMEFLRENSSKFSELNYTYEM